MKKQAQSVLTQLWLLSKLKLSLTSVEVKLMAIHSVSMMEFEREGSILSDEILHQILGHFVASSIHKYFADALPFPAHVYITSKALTIRFNRLWRTLLSPAAACQRFHRIISTIIRVIFELPSSTVDEHGPPLRTLIQPELESVVLLGCSVADGSKQDPPPVGACSPAMRAYCFYVIQCDCTARALRRGHVGESLNYLRVRMASGALEALENTPQCVTDALVGAVMDDIDREHKGQVSMVTLWDRSEFANLDSEELYEEYLQF